MDNRLFAPVMKTENGLSNKLDLNAFITRFLLFDHYTIDSPLLNDVAQLIKVFGIEGVDALLQSGCLSIHMSALTIGQMNHQIEVDAHPRPAYMKDNQQYILPYNHFYPTWVDITDRRQYIGHGLSNINKLGFTGKYTKKLKETILDNLTVVPEAHISYSWMKKALVDDEPIARQTLLNVLKAESYDPENMTSLEFCFKYIDDDILNVESNLQSIIAVDEFREHKIMEQVILALGGFYKRLSLMKSYSSIAWFSTEDSKLLESEITRVAINLNSNIQEQRLTRVINLKGLPQLGDIKFLNAHTLINLRNSRECKEFRDWLRTSDAKSDEDIKHEISSFTNAFKNILGTFKTRLARFTLTTSLGTALTVNPLVGAAAGATDQFILDKLIKKNGPIWFINNELPKLTDPYKQ